MLKLNAGFSRKIGEPNYGSRGASVNVELELESGLIGEPDALLVRIRKLFELARLSVDAELSAPPNASPASRSSSDAPARTPGTNGNQASEGRQVRFATDSQIRAIRSIAQRLNLDADQLAYQRARVNGIVELTVKEASSLIDELKSMPANGRNGGGR